MFPREGGGCLYTGGLGYSALWILIVLQLLLIKFLFLFARTGIVQITYCKHIIIYWLNGFSLADLSSLTRTTDNGIMAGFDSIRAD